MPTSASERHQVKARGGSLERLSPAVWHDSDEARERAGLASVS